MAARSRRRGFQPTTGSPNSPPSDKHHFADPALAGPASQRHCNRSDLGSADHAVNSAQRRFPRRALREPPGTQPARICPNGEAQVRHLRTQRGEHEVDSSSSDPMTASSPSKRNSPATVVDSDVKHLRWLRDRIGDRLLDARRRDHQDAGVPPRRRYRRCSRGVARSPAVACHGRIVLLPVHLAKRG